MLLVPKVFQRAIKILKKFYSYIKLIVFHKLGINYKKFPTMVGIGHLPKHLNCGPTEEQHCNNSIVLYDGDWCNDTKQDQQSAKDLSI